MLPLYIPKICRIRHVQLLKILSLTGLRILVYRLEVITSQLHGLMIISNTPFGEMGVDLMAPISLGDLVLGWLV